MNTFNLKQLTLFYTGIFQIAMVKADYLLMIRIHNFSTNCKECGTYFRFCAQEFNKSAGCKESNDHIHPGTILDFSSEFLLDQHNPISFWGYKWQGAQVNVTALDNHASDEVLCEARANLTTENIQVGIETTPVTYIGPTGQSNITVSFAVVCVENYYGQHCNFKCKHRDCRCDLSVPCHDNCVGVVCGENRHCVDGVNIYVCTCDRGFTGKRCDITSTTTISEVEGTSHSTEKNNENISLNLIIVGTVGWTLFISLGLMLIIALIYLRVKRNDNNCIRSEGRPTSTTASINPITTQIFHPRHNAMPDISCNDELQLNRNISHLATGSTSTQSSGASTTRVTASNGRNIQMMHNRAYQPELEYEYIDETTT